MPRILMILVALAVATTSAWSAGPDAGLSQKQFVQLMFGTFGWDSGLPKTPADRDYLQVLGGKRTFRYEAETAYNALTDRVTLRKYTLFGPFTGKGWILGVSDATTTNFTILLPSAGEYTLKAVVKGDGFVWKIDNKEYRCDAKSGEFREVEVGMMPLKAGVVKMIVTIPPEGAIDSFSLIAADMPPVQPFKGWRFKEPLTAASLAEIVVSLTHRLVELPDLPQAGLQPVSVAEVTTLPATAVRTHSTEFGKVLSSEWVRATYLGATLQIPLKREQAGFYGISATLMGGRVTGTVNDAPFTADAKAFLDRVSLGLFRLEAGDNLLTINLPPLAGIDTLELRQKDIMPAQFMKLAGITGPADRPITADEATTLLKSLPSAAAAKK